MKFSVDLNRCENNGQCTYSAEGIFALDDDGLLAFRSRTSDQHYVSDDIAEQDTEAVREAAQMCPMFAIDVIE